MGVVHHASYLPWLEMGRTELLRSSGVSYRQLEERGVFLVIVALECKYRRPARYDDELEIRTRVVGGGRVKIEHTYEVLRRDGAEDTLLLTARSTIACVGSDGRVQPLPDWLVPAG
jgi:acyl-CoA thioester hydrolase